MIYTKKKLVIVACALALLVTPTVALANHHQADDDWKTRLCLNGGDDGVCYRPTNIYVKEYSPKRNVTCYIAVAQQGLLDAADDNVGISCIKE